jgi:hypothetical protein
MALPFKRITRESVEADHLRSLQEQVAKLPNRLAFERWLLSFTNPAPGLTIAETREQVRRMLQPSLPWTVENLRAARLNQEAHERLAKERALRIVQRKAAD